MKKWVLIISIFFFNYKLIGQLNLINSQIPYFKFDTRNSLPSSEVYCIMQDSKGYIWMGTDRGVVRYNGYEFKTYTELDGLTDNVIFEIKEDKNGVIWFLGVTGPLSCFKEELGISPFEYNHKIDFHSNSKIHYFGNLFFDDSGHVILHGDLTLKFDNKFDDAESISISEIFLDENDGKLCKKKSRGQYTLFFEEDGDEKSIFYSRLDHIQEKRKLVVSNRSITDFIMDSQGGIWVSTLTDGVFYFPHLYISESYKFNRIDGLMPMGFDSIENLKPLLLSKEYPWEIYNSGKHIRGALKFNHGIHFSNLPDKDLKYVLGCQTSLNGDIRLWSQGSIVKCLSDKTYEKIYTNYKINCYLTYDKEELIGTYLGLYQILNGEIKTKIFDFGIITDRIQDIKYDDSKEILYVATLGNGIYIIKENKLVDHIGVNEGLNSSIVNHLFLDYKDRLWIATNKGLNYLEYLDEKVKIRNFLSSTKHLIANNFLQVGMANGIIHIGSDNGLIEVDMKMKESLENVKIPLYVTDVKVNNNAIEHWNEKLIKLRYNENNVDINFEALSFEKFGDLKYRYKLLSSENVWKETKRTQANFQNMPAGEYEFVVQVQNNLEQWIECEEKVRFSIDRPIWAKWWVILLASSFFGIMIWQWLNIRIAAIEKRNKTEKEIEIRLAKLKLEALQAQMNPHFIFNSLTAIQNYIFIGDKFLADEYLSKFSQLIRQFLEATRHREINLAEEIKLLKNYVQLEQLRFPNKFEFVIDADESVDLEFIKIPSMLLQPFIENAINHGVVHGDKKGLIEMSVKKNFDFLKIVIRDNGIGRAAAMLKSNSNLGYKSRGMQIIKDRMQIIGKMSDNDYDFEINDLKGDSGQVLGTEVTIQISNKFNENI